MTLFSRRNLLLFLVLPALVVIGLYLRTRLAGSVTPVRVVRARTGDLIQSFRTNGVVESVDFREIRATFPSQILAVLVKEGDHVHAGQSLARLDDRGAQAALAQARIELYDAEQSLAKTRTAASLHQLDAEIAQARSDLSLTQAILRRDETLVKQRAISQSEFEEAASARQKASDRLNALESQREALAREVAPLAQKQAQARLEQAHVALGNAENRLKLTGVPSPINGTVMVKPPRPGTLISVGELLAEVGNLDNLQVRAYIDQPDFSSIQVGSRVQIASSGFPGETWQGRVLSLSATLTTLGKRIVGEAFCSINAGKDRLPVNSNVDLTFTSRELHNVILLPVEAVLQRAGVNYVYTVSGGELHLTPVNVGASNADSIVVNSGIRPGVMVLDDLQVRPRPGLQVEPRQ